MNIIVGEIKKAVYAKYLTSTLWTTDKIPFYNNHVPQSVPFTTITFDQISSNNSMAMPSSVQPAGFDYIDSRFQFAVHSNDRQYSELEDVMNRLEAVFHRQALTLGNNCSHIGTICVNSRTKFYDEKQKIWTITSDFRFLAGR